MAENIAGSSQSGDKDDQDVFATLRKATDSLNKVADLLRDNGRGRYATERLRPVRLHVHLLEHTVTTVLLLHQAQQVVYFQSIVDCLAMQLYVPTVESTK